MAQVRRPPTPPMDLANRRSQGVRTLIASPDRDRCFEPSWRDASPVFKVMCSKCGRGGATVGMAKFETERNRSLWVRVTECGREVLRDA
jgi:hypothetical protein